MLILSWAREPQNPSIGGFLRRRSMDQLRVSNGREEFVSDVKSSYKFHTVCLLSEVLEWAAERFFSAL